MSLKQTTVGTYLLEALYRRGVRHIFGIPGDFALNFFRAIEEYGKLKLIALSHEPGLGFAADGLSRITQKMAAIAVTYGAGALNIVNAIGCAYAEKSPLVVISGAPGIGERGRGILFHHQAKNIQSQQNIFKEVTAYQAILENPETAAAEVERALTIAEELAEPVYLEIPRDRVFAPIPGKSRKFSFSLPRDKAASREAAVEVAERLRRAKRAVLMVGVEVRRFGLIRPVIRLAEKLRIPVVSSFLARSTFPADHPRFAGVYLGPAGDPRVMRLVENSDCLLLLGVLFADTNMALRLSHLNPRALVHAISRNVSVGHHLYEHVPLKLFLDELLQRAPVRRFSGSRRTPLPGRVKPAAFFDDSRLNVEAIIQAVNRLFEEKGDLPVIADNGDCLFASLDIRAENLLASAYYATMGFAVPAGMGVQIGSALRPLILVGDGAFQMTGPELSHCPRLGLNPILIVFNNRRWEMLRAIQPQGKYFDLTAWDFARLAKVWGGAGYRAETKRAMLQVLRDAFREKRFVLIDAILPLGETSKVLRNYLKRIRD